MLIVECEECKYLAKMIAVGQGVRCTHPSRHIEGSLPVSISQIQNCQLKEARTPSNLTQQQADELNELFAQELADV